jgi:hypothetical protein
MRKWEELRWSGWRPLRVIIQAFVWETNIRIIHWYYVTARCQHLLETNPSIAQLYFILTSSSVSVVTTLQAGWPGIRIPTEARSFCLLQTVQDSSAATHSPIQSALRPHTLQFNQLCGHPLSNSISSAATHYTIQSALRPPTLQFNQLCGHPLSSSISSGVLSWK